MSSAEYLLFSRVSVALGLRLRLRRGELNGPPAEVGGGCGVDGRLRSTPSSQSRRRLARPSASSPPCRVSRERRLRRFAGSLGGPGGRGRIGFANLHARRRLGRRKLGRQVDLGRRRLCDAGRVACRLRRGIRRGFRRLAGRLRSRGRYVRDACRLINRRRGADRRSIRPERDRAHRFRIGEFRSQTLRRRGGRRHERGIGDAASPA